MHRRPALLTLLIFTLITIGFAQEDKSKRPSPAEQATCKFPDGKAITVDYSSPRAKGRKIFGTKDEKALVPYGEVWRLGANEATSLKTDTDLTVGGKDVPAGSYTLFAIPNADKWTLIISKKTGEWGIPYPEGEDLARVDMQASKPSSSVENFTISFDQKDGTCTMHADWDDARASVDFAEKK